MTGQKVGYVRVSTVEQNSARQLDGLTLDKVFEDRLSGRFLDRPQLHALLSYVREGDTVFIHSIDRLARSVSDLIALVTTLRQKGVTVSFISEKLVLDAMQSPHNELVMTIFAALAQFERQIIRQRQQEGIELAKKAGRYKGRKPKLTEAQNSYLEDLIKSQVIFNRNALAREWQVSYHTIYRTIKKIENKLAPVDII